MGPCMSGGRSQGMITQQFQINYELTSPQYAKLSIQPIRPLHSTLYQMLRKASNFQIIHQSSKPQLLRNSTKPDISQMSPSELKILYNFKNVLIIGSIEPYLSIPRQVTLKNLFILKYTELEKFTERFPIFGYEGFSSINRGSQKNVLKAEPTNAVANTPLLIFTEQDIKARKLVVSDPRVIYIHSEKYRNQTLYNLLKIKKIVEVPSSKLKEQQTRYYLKQLQKPYFSILLLHDSNYNQVDLRNLISQHLVKEYKVSEFNAINYLMRFLPSKINPDDPITPSLVHKSNTEKVINQPKKEKDTLAITFKQNGQNSQDVPFLKILKKLGDESSQEIVERTYGISTLLLTNIYNHPERQQAYRKVKISNKNIEAITKYKNGRKLLEELGWIQQNQFWLNKVDSKYLKVFKVNIDIAYKRYLQASTII